MVCYGHQVNRIFAGIQAATAAIALSMHLWLKSKNFALKRSVGSYARITSAMYKQSYITLLFIFLLQTLADATPEPTIPFVDGIWRGEVEIGLNGYGFKECWASTTFSDGTNFTLAKRDDASWHLRLSNPGWQLPSSHRYDMFALVDFYPQQVSVTAEAKSETHLEITNLGQISLLGLIENGHTINLTSDGFNEKYDLEGSAKAIQRIRNCFAERS